MSETTYYVRDTKTPIKANRVPLLVRSGITVTAVSRGDAA